MEEKLPGIIESPGDPPAPQNKYDAVPPVMRPEIVSNMKVLTVSAEHPKLNRVQMFLGLPDRLARSEGEFLRLPHTTKLMWGSHRVIYIFTDVGDADVDNVCRRQTGRILLSIGHEVYSIAVDRDIDADRPLTAAR